MDSLALSFALKLEAGAKTAEGQHQDLKGRIQNRERPWALGELKGNHSGSMTLGKSLNASEARVLHWPSGECVSSVSRGQKPLRD